MCLLYILDSPFVYVNAVRVCTRLPAYVCLLYILDSNFVYMNSLVKETFGTVYLKTNIFAPHYATTKLTQKQIVLQPQIFASLAHTFNFGLCEAWSTIITMTKFPN